MIDIITVVIVGLAIFKGYSKGLIVAVFSLLGFIVGLAAAVKLSTVVASWLEANSGMSKQIIPSLAFGLVFIATVFLVRMGAKLVERSVSFVMLGWVNKLGGIAAFVILYLAILSIMLFYAKETGLINREQFANSQLYGYYKNLGTTVLNGLGTLIPWFKDMFQELQQFFGNAANNIAPLK
jgi:membrane protein required for colicin V production